MELSQKIMLRNTKDTFLLLCEQYENLGKLINAQSQIIGHPIFKESNAPVCMIRVLKQYQEMGEQLKEVGKGLDILGGEPVLEPKT